MVIKKLIKFLKKKKNKKKIKSKPKQRKKTKIKISKRIIIKKKSVKKFQKKTLVKKEKLIANSIHYFSNIKVAILKMKGALKINDKVHIKGHTTDFTQRAISMQINHRPVKVVKKGEVIGLLVKDKVRHKDKVYKI